MDSMNVNTDRKRRLRFRGRFEQIPIYLGKLLRSFVFMNDWKVLPMSAIIAALVAMVVRKDFFLTMEGTLKGALAMSCISIWNGCFNSIQSICRERNIIKREHRSGMHITSYVFAQMIYQFFLCLAQSVVTVYVCKLAGIQFPKEGFITPYMEVDIGITVFFITYASDMLSLLISSLSRTTTAAMTVIPFVLIFQLIFSGGIFSLPSWATNISDYTISNYGLRCIAEQADYNNLPMVTGWNTLNKVRDSEIVYITTVGELTDALSSHVTKETDETLEKNNAESTETGPEQIDNLFETVQSAAAYADTVLTEEARNEKVKVAFTIDQLMEIVGEERVKEAVQQKTAETARQPIYERTTMNIIGCWLKLALFALLFALLTIINLEFIDKDKR